MLNIKRTTKRWEAIKVFNRRAQVVITSVRIGYTYLTYSYHLEPPRCANYDLTLTVPHILHCKCWFQMGLVIYFSKGLTGLFFK
jgi:hypothetical protein